MITKVYDKIKKFLKQSYKLIIFFFVALFLLTFEFPYYINAPGGMIDISSRIKVESSYPVTGSFHLAYVSELRATIPTLVIAFFNKKWDVLKKEEVLQNNETDKEASLRSHIMLKEANDNAVMIGFDRAGKNVTVDQQKVYVTFIDPLSKTDLRVGDQILSVNEKSISNKQDLFETLKQYPKDTVIRLRVNHDGQELDRTATLFAYEDRVLIGIVLAETKQVKTDQAVSFYFKPSESGPSGGFMMALSIYNYLTEEDLTHGLKIGGTGTIDELGNVGSIGGIKYKIQGAVKNKIELFFAPAGENAEEARRVVEEHHYKLKVISISTIDEAIAYLKDVNNF